jgi:hypothetical protein
MDAKIRPKKLPVVVSSSMITSPHFSLLAENTSKQSREQRAEAFDSTRALLPVLQIRCVKRTRFSAKYKSLN